MPWGWVFLWLCCPNARRLGAASVWTVPMPYGWVSFLKRNLQECKNIGAVGSVRGAEGNAAVDFGYLGKGSTEFFELLRIRHDLVAISSGCLDLRTDKFLHQLYMPAKHLFDNCSLWCHGEHLVLLPLGRPRCERSRQAW